MSDSITYYPVSFKREQNGTNRLSTIPQSGVVDAEEPVKRPLLGTNCYIYHPDMSRIGVIERRTLHKASQDMRPCLVMSSAYGPNLYL
jgi:hypothetical protein